MSVEAILATPSAGATGARRLLVATQQPTDRAYRAVGLLVESSRGFAFEYLPGVGQVPDFAPLPGFPVLERVYESQQLFPLFAQRVMNERRPDYTDWLAALGLPPEASTWDVLTRSHGHRVGDEIRVFAEPEVDSAGASTASFLVHGLRYRLRVDASVEGILAQLRAGDALSLIAEPTNSFNRQAVQVAESSVPLGWVPDVLAEYAQTLLACGIPSVVVEHVNSADVPPNYRLLVRVTGTVPAGYHPFDRFSASRIT